MLKPMVLVALCLLTLPAAAQTKIGVVDVKAALESSPEWNALQEQLKKAEADMVAQNEKTLGEFKKQQKAFEEAERTMKKEDREARRAELAAQYTQFAEKVAGRRAELDRKRESSEQSIRIKLTAAIGTVAKRDKFDLVLPRDSALFVGNVLDMTSAASEALNAAPKK